jgi:hypothetical protein
MIEDDADILFDLFSYSIIDCGDWMSYMVMDFALLYTIHRLEIHINHFL